MDLLKINSENQIEHYYDKLTEKFFRPLILSPTRIAKDSKTLIDNIFTNRFTPGTSSGNITVGISDHMPQFCFIPQDSNTKLNNVVKYTRDFKNFPQASFIEEFNRNIPNMDLEVTKYTNELVKTLDTLVNKYAPVRKKTQHELKRDEKPWITQDILKKIRKKDRTYRKYIKTDNPLQKVILNEKIKTMKNEITQVIRRSKSNYYKNYFRTNSKNSRKLWAGINEIINTKSKNTTLPTCITGTKAGQDENITDSKMISNAFNNHYTKVADKLLHKRKFKGNKPFTQYLKNSTTSSIVMHPVTPEEVSDIIQNLDVTKSTGPNSIPPKILKQISTILINPISLICNKSFSSGIYPDILKISKVIPIFKKDSRLDVENYRPISLISNIDKIIEKLVFARLYNFLEVNKSLYKLQFGFRNKHSTNHALLSMIQQIQDALDNNNIAIGVFVDFKKAFDTVNHKILLRKLFHYGVRSVANSWFDSYLSNRKQFVSINGVDSTLESIEHGVPQGSVLGPLLFLIYINDLHECIHNSTVRHFADDTNLLYIIKKKERNRNVYRKLNTDLKALKNWLLANKISLNATKTEVIMFKKKSQPKPYGNIVLDGVKLEFEKITKYVGLTIDENLTFKPHIEILNSKLKRANNMLSISRHYSPKDILLNIYFSQFHSHLNYGCQIWTNGNNINTTAALQNRALRIINFSDFQADADPIYKSHNILKIRDLAKMQKLLFVHDALNDLAPAHFSDYFKFYSQQHSYNTVNNPSSQYSRPLGSLALPDTNSIFGTRTAKYSCAKVWNDFIREIAQSGRNLPQFSSMSRNSFKKLVKSHILSTI